MSLDLDYRPRLFADVLGNEGPRKLLITRSRNGTLANQSAMFGGPKGCGKTTLARIVARAIKCASLQDGEPCGECVPCKSISDETYQSVEELDSASQGTVDRIREMIKDADYGSFDGQNLQVYILDEAQRLTKAAQDTLLKAIESRLFMVILCTTEPHKIQGPIRDRLEEHSIKAPILADLVHRLDAVCSKEGIDAEKDALQLIANMTGCTPRSSLLAVEALSQLGAVTIANVRDYYRFGSYELVDKVLFSIDTDPRAAFGFLDDLVRRESPSWIRDAMILAISSGMRADVGAKATYPIPTRSFQTRLRGWASFASLLGGIDRPSYADIEAGLLLDCHSFSVGHSAPIVQPPHFSIPPSDASLPIPSKFCSVCGKPQFDSPSGVTCENSHGGSPSQDTPVITKAPEPATLPPRALILPQPRTSGGFKAMPPKVAPLPPEELSVDGIKFTPGESLTSLDNRISASDGVPGSAAVMPDIPDPQVPLDKSRVPITEKAFIQEFNRLGKR